MKIDWIPIHQIRLNPRNRNKHSESDIQAMMKMIKAYGWRHPLIVSNQTHFLVVGECRFLAAKKLKEEKVPISFQDFQSPEEEYGFGIADNASGKWGQLDMRAINEDIVDLGPDFDVTLLGIKDFEIEEADRGDRCEHCGARKRLKKALK